MSSVTNWQRLLNSFVYSSYRSGKYLLFEVKDSGVRHIFESGMVRDVTDDKTDYTLVLDGPMFDRWAEHMTAGAKKYDARNWMKAQGEAEYERFQQSALRHFLQWFRGEQDEDHAAAVFFNINGAEYVRDDAKAWADVMEPDVHGCDGCEEGCGFCGFDHNDATKPGKLPPAGQVFEDFLAENSPIPASAKVGDVTTDDLITVIWEEGGLQDLADDYNYLRNRVQELNKAIGTPGWTLETDEEVFGEW
jgi:hypothetical protein